MLHLRARFASNPKSVAKARRAIADFARSVGFSGDDVFDIQLAVGEALANAAEHAVRGGATRFDVFATVEDHALVVEVQDNGCGFRVARENRPESDPMRIRGYGTSIMRSVMDRVEYTFEGTCVRLMKRLPDATFNSLEERS